MSKPKIAIVISTTREGRFGDKPARWIHDLASARGDADYEILDLRDHPLPFFNEPKSLGQAPPQNEAALRWGELIGTFDGFVFITAEYNHGISGVLKNALDYAYAQWNRKPAAFVGYGGVGGARAVEQLRLNCVELQMAPLRNAVHIGMNEFMGLMGGKSFADFPHLGSGAGKLLDELAWWTAALKNARRAG